jgi:hypothetical protein
MANGRLDRKSVLSLIKNNTNTAEWRKDGTVDRDTSQIEFENIQLYYRLKKHYKTDDTNFVSSVFLFLNI